MRRGASRPALPVRLLLFHVPPLPCQFLSYMSQALTQVDLVCPTPVHTPALRRSDSMHCRCDQPWSAATSGRNVAVRLHCKTGSVNSMMRPCVPICQSCQLSARSKLHKSETEQLRCATSFSCTGENRESRKALQDRHTHGRQADSRLTNRRQRCGSCMGVRVNS
jgi:hypothetical protein